MDDNKTVLPEAPEYQKPTTCNPAQKDDDRTIVPCVGFSWDVVLKLRKNSVQYPSDITLQPSPESLVSMDAVPTERKSFRFRVRTGTFRRLHIEWPLDPFCPNLKVYRVYQCSENCCDVTEKKYEFGGCPTILPPGDYIFYLDVSEVCAVLSAEGAKYNVELWLEYITHDYILAYNASNMNKCG